MAKYMSTMFVRGTDIWREAVEVDALRQRLQEHALGKIHMEATEIKAAEILLRKCIPDLKAIEHSGSIDTGDVRDLTDAELLSRYDQYKRQRLGAGAVRAALGAGVAASVHRVHDPELEGGEDPSRYQ